MSKITSLEDRVLNALLSGNDETLEILRTQLQRAHIASRELTGAGFFLTLSIPVDVPRISGLPSFRLGDVNGVAPGLENGLGFVLFVNKGTLDMLEGYTYDEPWPSEIHGVRLTYSTGVNRDMEAVRKAIRGS